MARNIDQPQTPYTRRDFLHSTLALASAAAVVPQFINASAYGLPRPAQGMSSIPGAREDRVLVVIQLSGGNDGLNTVVPFTQDAYYRARPGIALQRDAVMPLAANSREHGADLGFHRALAGVRDMYDEGICSVIQGVGYPNPNRSHFKSMDIWHTADTSGTGDGWLGRYVDSECCGYGAGESGQAPENAPQQLEPPVSIGRSAPLALQGRRMKPVAFETADLFRWTGEDVHESLVDPYQALAARDHDDHDHPTASFLMKTALDAQASSDAIRRAVSARPLVQYPRSNLGRQLSMVANMVRAGLKTRVYYVTHGGFDTHAGQGGPQGRHANLLSQFSEAVRAFYNDLAEQGNDSRVLTMSFSEFGRRVGQNASGGTDHGTAAPMMLFGPMVRAGVLGDHPSLVDLDNGDLKYRVDFRSVYAGVLKNWMEVDPDPILGGRFRAAEIIRPT